MTALNIDNHCKPLCTVPKAKLYFILSITDCKEEGRKVMLKLYCQGYYATKYNDATSYYYV